MLLSEFFFKQTLLGYGFSFFFLRFIHVFQSQSQREWMRQRKKEVENKGETERERVMFHALDHSPCSNKDKDWAKLNQQPEVSSTFPM